MSGWTGRTLLCRSGDSSKANGSLIVLEGENEAVQKDYWQLEDPQKWKQFGRDRIILYIGYQQLQYTETEQVERSTVNPPISPRVAYFSNHSKIMKIIYFFT